MTDLVVGRIAFAPAPARPLPPPPADQLEAMRARKTPRPQSLGELLALLRVRPGETVTFP